MKKIACIIGTRPQLIKHAALLKELEKIFKVDTINTVQHYQSNMNEVLKNELYVDKNFIDLNIESKSLHSSARLGKMIDHLTPLIHDINPDGILVYGDTDSTLAGALVANKNQIPLIHIEAGERSFNKDMPEERNRVITDYLSQILFCSSKESMENLKKENITENIFYTGDLMKDLLQSKLDCLLRPDFSEYIFCTIHRNYNKNNPEKLRELLEVLNSIRKQIVFSAHPATINVLSEYGIELQDYKNIQVVPPLSYIQSISYQQYSSAVVTDSGGIQKEAYWLKKPCITIRTETEWTATLVGNWNQLLYEDLNEIHRILEITPAEKEYDELLYGNGAAAATITHNISQLI
jgi:UDP-GlcNAc3NAcA epimerase